MLLLPYLSILQCAIFSSSSIDHHQWVSTYHSSKNAITHHNQYCKSIFDSDFVVVHSCLCFAISSCPYVYDLLHLAKLFSGPVVQNITFMTNSTSTCKLLQIHQKIGSWQHWIWCIMDTLRGDVWNGSWCDVCDRDLKILHANI